MSPEDRGLLALFASRVRRVAPSAAIWAFGSRARGSASPESDFDLCVIVPHVNHEVKEAIHAIAWEIGFEHGTVLAPVLLSEADFDRGPMSASTLVVTIRREGVAA